MTKKATSKNQLADNYRRDPKQYMVFSLCM